MFDDVEPNEAERRDKEDEFSSRSALPSLGPSFQRSCLFLRPAFATTAVNVAKADSLRRAARWAGRAPVRTRSLRSENAGKLTPWQLRCSVISTVKILGL